MVVALVHSEYVDTWHEDCMNLKYGKGEGRGGERRKGWLTDDD